MAMYSPISEGETCNASANAGAMAGTAIETRAWNGESDRQRRPGPGLRRRHDACLSQSTLAPEAFTTLPHLSMSAFRTAANS